MHRWDTLTLRANNDTSLQFLSITTDPPTPPKLPTESMLPLFAGCLKQYRVFIPSLQTNNIRLKL